MWSGMLKHGLEVYTTYVTLPLGNVSAVMDE